MNLQECDKCGNEYPYRSMYELTEADYKTLAPSARAYEYLCESCHISENK